MNNIQTINRQQEQTMLSEKNLPPVNPIEATRYVAGKIGHYALYDQKGHRPIDFTRPTADSEREQIASLSLAKIGAAALFQYNLEDTTVHIDGLS